MAMCMHVAYNNYSLETEIKSKRGQQLQFISGRNGFWHKLHISGNFMQAISSVFVWERNHWVDIKLS